MPKQLTPKHVARRRANIFVGVLCAAALAGPLAIGVAASASSKADEAVAATASEGDVLHRAFAELVAHRWAHSEGELVAAGSGTWSDDAGRPRLDSDTANDLGVSAAYAQAPGGQGDLGAVRVAWQSADTIATGDRLLEMHRFLVLTERGIVTLTVPVTETATEPPQPALGGNPAVEPYLIDVDLAETPAADWPTEMSAAATPGNIAERAREWAEAFAVDDQRTLFQLAGETNDELAYRGLGEFDLAEVEVGSSASRGDGFSLTRVSLTLSNTYGVVLNADYDLLIANPDDPTPAVVAWGARGHGPALTPGQNATSAGSAPLGGYGVRTSDPAGGSAAGAFVTDDEPEPEPDHDDEPEQGQEDDQ